MFGITSKLLWGAVHQQWRLTYVSFVPANSAAPVECRRAWQFGNRSGSGLVDRLHHLVGLEPFLATFGTEA